MKRPCVNRVARIRRVTGGPSPLVVLLVAAALGSCGGPGGRPDPQPDAASGLPAGYALRLDRENRNPANFVATATGDGLRIRTGPAGILYQPDQVIDADSYTVQARFTEVEAPVGHREGFGLFVGGRDLERRDLRYTYFLVRADGRYLVKRREGQSTEEISNGWEASDAVHVPAAGGGDVTNELAITVDGGHVVFSCNGAPVVEIPVGDLSVWGVAGVRLNHNLDVRVEELRVEAPP